LLVASSPPKVDNSIQHDGPEYARHETPDEVLSL